MAYLCVVYKKNNNSLFLSAASTKNTPEIPEIPLLLPQIENNVVTEHTLINCLNQFWSLPVTLGYNQLP